MTINEAIKALEEARDYHGDAQLCIADTAVINADGQEAWEVSEVCWSDYHECFVMVKGDKVEYAQPKVTIYKIYRKWQHDSGDTINTYFGARLDEAKAEEDKKYFQQGYRPRDQFAYVQKVEVHPEIALRELVPGDRAAFMEQYGQYLQDADEGNDDRR